MCFFHVVSMCVSTLDVMEGEMQVLPPGIMVWHCTKFPDSCFFLLQIILSFPILTLSEIVSARQVITHPPSSCSSLSPPVSLYNGLFLVFSSTGLSGFSSINTALNIF